jgi:hypothetical protein
MHGLTSPEGADQTARRIVAVTGMIARVLGDDLGKFTIPAAASRKIDHTTWARLLFLSTNELLWIAQGRPLPMNDTKNAPSAPVLIRNQSEYVAVRMTDRHHGNSETRSGLHLSETLAECEVVWVSTTSFKLDRIELIKQKLQPLAPRYLEGASSTNRYRISFLSEGIDDVASDCFGIPWWKKAPEDERYICISSC